MGLVTQQVAEKLKRSDIIKLNLPTLTETFLNLNLARDTKRNKITILCFFSQ